VTVRGKAASRIYVRRVKGGKSKTVLYGASLLTLRKVKLLQEHRKGPSSFAAEPSKA